MANTKTPKMFRGHTRGWVEDQFVGAGWPQPLAHLMSGWAVGVSPLPQWPTTNHVVIGPDIERDFWAGRFPKRIVE